MTDSAERDASRRDDGFERHRARQRRDAHAMTFARRLRWLEETMAEMQRMLGRAWRGVGARLARNAVRRLDRQQVVPRRVRRVLERTARRASSAKRGRGRWDSAAQSTRTW